MRQGFGPQGWDLGFQARIWSLSLGFVPQGWYLGLKTGICASRLEFGLRDWDLRRGMKEKEEKIPHICESIGHQPLRGRCPATPSTSSTTYSGRASNAFATFSLDRFKQGKGTANNEQSFIYFQYRRLALGRYQILHNRSLLPHTWPRFQSSPLKQVAPLLGS